MQHCPELNVVTSNKPKIIDGKMYSWGVIFWENVCHIWKGIWTSNCCGNVSCPGRLHKNRVNSFKVAEGHRAVHWRKDLLLGFPLAHTCLIHFTFLPSSQLNSRVGELSFLCPQSNLIPQGKWMALARQLNKIKENMFFSVKQKCILATNDCHIKNIWQVV